MSMGTLTISRLSPHSILGIGFVAYASASLVWGKGDKAYALTYLVFMVSAYLLGQITRSDRTWIGVCVLSIAIFAIQPWFIVNPNVLGCFLAISVAGAIAYRLWYFLPFLFAGLWWGQSRGALFATGVVCFVGLWRWSRFWALILPLAAILLILTQKPESIMPIASRLGVWQDTINHLIPFGHGWGSFQAHYAAFPVRTNMTLELAPHAYNDYLELISDLGIGALFLFLLVIIAWERDNPAAKLILLTFFALSLTYFPLWIPIVGHLFAYALGDLTSQERNT